ncbi:MAG: NAD(P)H-dependent oxidoreductase [Oscillibacter sp.]
MKIVAINGSPRKNGNTAQVLRWSGGRWRPPGWSSGVPARGEGPSLHWPATTA